MTKKVGKQDLKKLIENVLNEDTVQISNIKNKLYKKKKDVFDNYKDDIEDLASNDNAAGSISQADVSTAYTEPNQSEIDAARYLSQGITMGNKTDRNKMLNFVGSAEADATEFSASDVTPVDAKDIRSMAFKSMQNLSADPQTPLLPWDSFRKAWPRH